MRQALCHSRKTGRSPELSSRRSEVSSPPPRQNFQFQYKRSPLLPLPHTENPLFQKTGNPAFCETGAAEFSVPGLRSPDSAMPGGCRTPRSHTGPSLCNSPSSSHASVRSPALLPSKNCRSSLSVSLTSPRLVSDTL